MEAQSANISRQFSPPKSSPSPPPTPDSNQSEAEVYFKKHAVPQSFNNIFRTESRKSQTDWIIPVDSQIDFSYNLETQRGRVSLSDAPQVLTIPRKIECERSTYTLPPSPVDQYEDSVRDHRPTSPFRHQSPVRRTLHEYRPLSPARSPVQYRSDSFNCGRRPALSPPARPCTPPRNESPPAPASLVIDERPPEAHYHPHRHLLPPHQQQQQNKRADIAKQEHQFLRPDTPKNRAKDPYSMRHRATIEHHPEQTRLNADKPFDLSIKFKHKLHRYRAIHNRMGANNTSLENLDTETLKASDLFNNTTLSVLENVIENHTLNNATVSDPVAGSSSSLTDTRAGSSGTSDNNKTPSPSTSYKSDQTDKPEYVNANRGAQPGKPGPMPNNMADLNNFPSPDTPGHPYKDQLPMPGPGFPFFPAFGALPRYPPMLTALNQRDGMPVLPGIDGRMDPAQQKALDELAVSQYKLLATMGLPSTRPDMALKYSEPLYSQQPSPSSQRSQSRYSDISDCPPPKMNNRDYNVNIIDTTQNSPLSTDGREFASNSPMDSRPGYSRADHDDVNKYGPGFSPHSMSMSQTIADSLRLCTGNGKSERMDGSPCAYSMDRRLSQPYTPSGELMNCNDIKKEFDANSECAYGDKSNAEMYNNMMAGMPARVNSDYGRKRTSGSSFGSDSDSSGVKSPKPTKYRKAIENILCSVCGDAASGFHCGAYVCEACKKFFIRSSKNESVKFVCSKQKKCDVTKESRTQCQYCRYQKCLNIGMFKPGMNPLGNVNANMSNFPCRVCGAPSSGYHFGAITCEGCKGFFRRTIKERDSHRYVCPKRGQCTVTMVTRNFCKFCRYQKCLQVGMTPEGSRIGRQPNSVKHQTLMELQQISTSPLASPSSSEPATPKPKDVASPYLARRQETGFTREDMDVVISSLMSSYNHLKLLRKKPDGVGDIPEYELMTMWDYMMKQFNHDAHNVLRFAKKIPGFKTLPVEDQIILLQNSMYQTCMFMHVDQYNPESDQINYFNFSDRDRNAIMSILPEFRVFERHYHYFGQTFHPLELDSVETACMVALQIVSPVDSAMKTWKEVARLQETISISLQMYIEEKLGTESERFGMLLLQLPALNSAGIKHQQVVTTLRNEKPQLPFPQLFRELFLSYEEQETKFSAEEKDLIAKGIALCEKMNERTMIDHSQSDTLAIS